MSARDEFLPSSWFELGHALASMLVFALLMAVMMAAPAFAPELTAWRPSKTASTSPVPDGDGVPRKMKSTALERVCATPDGFNRKGTGI